MANVRAVASKNRYTRVQIFAFSNVQIIQLQIFSRAASMSKSAVEAMHNF